MTTAESEARRTLNRLRRSIEKSRRELEALAGAIRHAQGEDFPTEAYADAQSQMDGLMAFVDDEARRLQDRILQSGGLEPGRIRRGSS